MIFRASILVVASLAAFAVSPVKSKRLKKQHTMLSAKGCSSSQEIEWGGEKFGDKIPEEDMQEEEEEEEEETKAVNSRNMEIVLKPNLTRKRICEKLELDRECKLGNTEIEHSQNLIKELETRRVTLEGKLLELYSLKEKLSYIACLQRNLDGKTLEIDKLNFALFALSAEIKELQEITRQGNLAVKQLEMAKKMIEEMQMKNGNASQIKAQIVVLEEQLSRFTANETSARDALVNKRFEAVKNIELQVLKMRRRNKELELEKRELLVKLYAAHAKVSALSDITENKTIAKISELRHANGDLSNEVERLQKSRFDMVEELVYQRWLNACLRSEIQEHQTSSRKTLQKELQKASDQKPRKIITQYPDTNSISSSSYTSSTDSEEIDSSTIGSSSSDQRSISKNSGTGHSASWKSMDGSSVVSSPDKSSIGSPLERSGIICRFSSMVPSKTSMLSTKLDGSTSSKKNVPVLKDFSETKEMPNLTKVRKVSFNDAVETVSSAKIVLTKSVEGVLDDKEIVTLVSGHRSRVKAGVESQSPLPPSSEVSLAKPDQSSDSNRRSIDEDDRDAQEVSWIANARPEGELHSGISNAIPNENNMESLIKPLVFAFLFSLLVLLLFFLHLSARIY